MPNLILASTSKGRKKVLNDAGIKIGLTVDAGIDEDIIKSKFNNAVDIANQLSCEKALAVSKIYKDDFVIGGDQTLSYIDDNGETVILNSPKTADKVAQHIKKLSGKKHTLHAGIAVAKNNEIVFSGVFDANMTMRDLSDEFITWYAEECSDKVKKSVGGYHFEGLGAQLFENIDGDYFTILGLPLIPLITFLRQQEVLIK